MFPGRHRLRRLLRSLSPAAAAATSRPEPRLHVYRSARAAGEGACASSFSSSTSLSRTSVASVVPHLSFSSIRSFLECPRRFYYGSLLRLPQVPNVNMVYGSAVHQALDTMFSAVESGVDAGGEPGRYSAARGQTPQLSRRWATLPEVLCSYHASWDASPFGPSSAHRFPTGVKDVRDLGARHVAAFYRRYRTGQPVPDHGAVHKAGRSRPGGAAAAAAAAASAGSTDASAADSIMHCDAGEGWTIAPERQFEVTLGGRRPGEPTVVVRGVWDLLCEPHAGAHARRGGGASGGGASGRSSAACTTNASAGTGDTGAAGAGPTQPLPTVIEFKSTLGASPTRPRNWHAPHLLQLNTYAMAYRKWADAGGAVAEGGCGGGGGHGGGAVRVVLKSVESGEEYTAVCTDDDVAEAEEFILDVHARIQVSDFRPTPTYQACNFCPYSHICPAADGHSARYQGRAGPQHSLLEVTATPTV